MREFKDKTLTAAGRSLIAKATVENKLEFVGAISSVNYMATPVLVNANISDFEGPTGSIAVASANGDVVRVVAEYPFAENDTMVKTVAITAKLHGQSDSEAIIIAAQSDPDVSVFIPAKAGIATSTQVSFNIFISDNGSGTVEIVLTKGVNLGDFEDLMKSTVTKHSIRNSSSGDDQTILGTKTFTNPISAESSVTILGSLTASGQSTFTGDVTTNKLTSSNMYIGTNGKLYISESNNLFIEEYNSGFDFNGHVYPYSNGAFDLGSNGYKWNVLYINTVNASSASFEGNVSIVGTLSAGATTLNNTLSVNGKATLNNDLDVVNNTNLQGTLDVTGVSTFKDISATSVDSNDIHNTTGDLNITSNANLNLKSGTSSATNYIISSGASLYPSVRAIGNIGTADNMFNSGHFISLTSSYLILDGQSITIGTTIDTSSALPTCNMVKTYVDNSLSPIQQNYVTTDTVQTITGAKNIKIIKPEGVDSYIGMDGHRFKFGYYSTVNTNNLILNGSVISTTDVINDSDSLPTSSAVKTYVANNVPTNVVTTDTVQTITGNKTFTGSTILSSLNLNSRDISIVSTISDTSSTEIPDCIAIKEYITNEISPIEGNYVTTNTTQTITGQKTFNSVKSLLPADGTSDIGNSTSTFNNVYTEVIDCNNSTSGLTLKSNGTSIVIDNNTNIIPTENNWYFGTSNNPFSYGYFNNISSTDINASGTVTTTNLILGQRDIQIEDAITDSSSNQIPTSAAVKTYVANSAGVPTNVVTTDTDQTITGVKSFTGAATSVAKLITDNIVANGIYVNISSENSNNSLSISNEDIELQVFDSTFGGAFVKLTVDSTTEYSIVTLSGVSEELNIRFGSPNSRWQSSYFNDVDSTTATIDTVNSKVIVPIGTTRTASYLGAGDNRWENIYGGYLNAQRGTITTLTSNKINRGSAAATIGTVAAPFKDISADTVNTRYIVNISKDSPLLIDGRLNGINLTSTTSYGSGYVTISCIVDSNDNVITELIPQYDSDAIYSYLGYKSGTVDNSWTKTYTKELNTDNIIQLSGTELSVGNSTAGSTLCLKAHESNLNTWLYFNGSALRPDGSCDLGTVDYTFNNVYTDIINSNTIQDDTSITLKVNSNSIVIDNNTNILPTESNWYLGNSSHTFGAVYASTFHGLATKATGDQNGNNIYTSYGRSLSKSECNIQLKSMSGAVISTFDARPLIKEIMLGPSSNTSSWTKSYVGSVRLAVLKADTAASNWHRPGSLTIDGSALKPLSFREVAVVGSQDYTFTVNAFSDSSTYTGTWTNLDDIMPQAGKRLVSLFIRTA